MCDGEKAKRKRTRTRTNGKGEGEGEGEGEERESRELPSLFSSWGLDSSSASCPSTILTFMTSSVDFLQMNRFDIVQIYRHYCEIRSQNGFCHVNEDSGHVETQMTKSSKQALAKLLIYVQSSLQMGKSIVDELSKLMSYLNLMVDFYEFSRFYEFVFFVCREDGQKNITVSRAVRAWRLVLVGRFRLLNQWCDFVENNQRHNISEDTWQQVLAFSRCVHENLEGYDPEGAWPVLIDDFVEHMYRRSGFNKISNLCCSCGETESHSGVFEDSLPGLKFLPGLKRKLPEDMQMDGMVSLGDPRTGSMELSPVISVKKSRFMACKPLNLEINLPSCTADESTEMVRHNNGAVGCSKSPCAVEGCLSKGFAGLFSTHLFLGLDQERNTSFT